MTQNMRLSLASAHVTDATTTAEEVARINKEIEYAATIKAIGEGEECTSHTMPLLLFCRITSHELLHTHQPFRFVNP